MALRWNEIKDRTLKLSKEWADIYNDDALVKAFLDAFFDVFGMTRKRMRTYKHRVRKSDDGIGYLDMLWKGVIIVEMQCKGINPDQAFIQTREYTNGQQQHELSKYVLVSDFDLFCLYDTEANTTIEFNLSDFINNVQLFYYLICYQKNIYKEEDPVNTEAAELMGKPHDPLGEIAYTGHLLEAYLVRILFFLFAEDTTIFNKQQFQKYIERRSSIDGSNLAAKLQELFQVLNTLEATRIKNPDERLADFPYVNGKLFEELLPTASFDSKMRQALLNCSYIDWSKISLVVFASMFQSVMDPEERRDLGAQYTSEINNFKLIKPLFPDELLKVFDSIKDNKKNFRNFIKN